MRTKNSGHDFFVDFLNRSLLPAIGLLFLLSAATQAIPLSAYHRQIKRAVTALDTLAQSDETESAWDYAKRDAETIDAVRKVLPRSETVEWEGTSVSADNSWLHQELDKYRTVKFAGRAEMLRRMKDRLQAIDERITEVVGPGTYVAGSKSDDSRRLQEILSRVEYARTVKQPNAITRLLQQFLKWLENLFPKPKGLSPGIAGLFSKIAQIVVILLALAVLAYVAKLFLPQLLRSRGTKRKKTKGQARIVMGERLDPDQTAVDLLAEAEGLARRGELRAAIRKAYIALLLELGDRKIISLAQYKTNRDYLRAVRNIEHLYGNVKQLTDSFELHWYGRAQATETDWLAFRSAYNQALLK
ncbi:MAG: DUF4129 domain-containing protein [Pyrinomonadaceae bacterium]|nr:DUF4129 domain-containing protein [Pyrinomonadaceae bacterium]